MLGLGPLSKRFSAHQGQLLLVWGEPLKRFQESPQSKLRQAGKATGSSSAWCMSWVRWGLGIIKAGQTVLARLMESTDLTPTHVCRLVRFQQREQWHCQHFCLETAVLTPAPPAFSPKLVNSVPPHISLALFKLLPLQWSPEQVSFCVSKCMHGPLKMNT